MRLISGLLFFLLFVPFLNAQKPELYFKSINTASGLSHNKVNCILQDKRGFIWIGTDDGLNRFDGNNFLVFRHQAGAETGISGNIINDLHEDKNGLLWIATADGGLSRYDYRLQPDKQFKQYKNHANDKSSIPANIINKIAEDGNGYLWIATSGKRVIRFNKQTEKFDEPVSTGTSTILSLCLDNNNTLWVGRQGGGLLKLNTINLKYQEDERYSNLYGNLPHAVITSLFMDSEKRMWFGSWDRVVYKYNPSQGLEKIFKPSNSAGSFITDEIDDITEDNDGRLWMAGRYAGLHVYDKKQDYFYNYRFNASLQGTMADDKTNCVFIDKSNNLWVGTDKGISTSNLRQQFVQQFLPAQYSSNKPVTIYDFHTDKNNTLWIATDNGIYSRKNSESQFNYMPLSFNGQKIAVTKFYKDEDGTMYFGTNYSLFRYNDIKRGIELLEDRNNDKVMNPIIESRVVSIIRDTINNNPVLLTSPYGHFLTYYDLIKKQWVSRLDSSKNIVSSFNLTDNLIRKFYRSSNGSIWLATVKDGLGYWDKRPMPKVQYFKNDPAQKKSLANNNIYDITDDGKGGLWLTTYGGGLQHFDIDNKSCNHISSSSNLLEGIQTGNDGNVWMIGSGMLHQYNPESGTHTTFELPDVEKTGGVKGYIYKDPGGLLYLSGLNYFIAFNPETIKEDVKEPEVILTDFRIFNQSYSHLLDEEKIKLRYNQNFFAIEFAAPYYNANEKIQYSYMLEGVDKDWVDAGTRNFANYPNTGSGDFTFKVRASVGNGKWIEKTTALKIEVIPPFWKTIWFYLLLLALISIVIYMVYRYRVNELMQRQAIRNKIAQDLHDSMGSALSSISVYSQVAKIYEQKEQKEKLEQALDKISSTSGEMISEMNDIVWAINPQNDNLEKITQRMESYAKPLLQAKNISFSFSYPYSLKFQNLPMELRKNFYLIFKEAVNNALKYSECKSMEVYITTNHNRVVLEVKDDGKGFDITEIEKKAGKSLSGNGLANMKRRAEEMKGDLTIASTPGKGTLVRLSIIT
jgi:ligand-binding sensor domain-containing protein